MGIELDMFGVDDSKDAILPLEIRMKYRNRIRIHIADSKFNNEIIYCEVFLRGMRTIVIVKNIVLSDTDDPLLTFAIGNELYNKECTDGMLINMIKQVYLYACRDGGYGL